MLTIYSIGDPWYLGKVMDAIAMISGHNAGFVGASAVAAIIGVFIVMFSTVIKMQGLNIHHLLICYVMYMGCFGTTTDVAIESVYSDKSVIQKDNVPYGPAVIGSIISTIGYGLTQKMEVAFSDTSPLTDKTDSSGGYANPLYLINNLANWCENGQLLKEIESTSAGKQFARNFMTYVKECTTKAVYLGPTFNGKTFDDVFNLPQNDDIGFSSELYSTELIDPSTGKASNYSCKEGINLIKTQFASALSEFAGKTENLVVLYQKLGKCTTTLECKNIISAGNFTDAIQDSLEHLRLGHYKAQSVMYAGLTDSLKKTGLAYGYAHYKDQQAATMLFQAVKQRNVQWAAEANMFLNSFKPMMAFIEGFFYAISPFAAIIMLLGLFGLNIFFKYLILLIWIQLWMPIMAIANMFIITSARELLYNEGVQASTHAGANLSSISTYMYEDLVAVTQDKIAVASIMLASTPVLALMLMTGSVYAFTSLTGKLAGGDHANEKLVSPDVVAPSAYMTLQSASTGDVAKRAVNGLLDNSINLSDGIGLSVSNASQKMESLQNTLSTNVIKGLSEVGALNSEHGLNAAIQHIRNGSQGQEWSKSVSAVEQAVRESGYSLEGVNSQRLTMALSTPNPKGVLPGGIKAEQAYGLNEKEAKLFKDLSSKSSALSQVDKSQIASLVASGLTEGYGTKDSYVKSAELKSQLSKGAQNLISATDQYSTLYDAQQRIGTQATFTTLDAISSAVIANGHSLSFVDKTISEAKNNLTDYEKQLYESKYKRLYDQYDGQDIGSYREQQLRMKALNEVNSDQFYHAAAKMANFAGIGGNISEATKDVYSKATADNIAKAGGVDMKQADDIANSSDALINKQKEASQEFTPKKWQTVSDTYVDSIETEAKIQHEQQQKANDAAKGLAVANLHPEDYQDKGDKPAKLDRTFLSSSKNSDKNYTVSVKDVFGDYNSINKGNDDQVVNNYKEYFNKNDQSAYIKSNVEFDRYKGVGTQATMMDMAHLAYSKAMAAKETMKVAEMSMRKGDITADQYNAIKSFTDNEVNNTLESYDTASKRHVNAIGKQDTAYLKNKRNDLINSVNEGDHSIYTDKFNDRKLTGETGRLINDEIN